MNEILKKRIEEAAAESRRASAETLTTFGLQSSIDDVVELTGMELSYDEVAESAFEKGAQYALSHQWISIEDALPECSVMVLVKDKYGNYDIAYLSKKGYWIANDGKEIIVSFWLPIPKFGTKKNE